MRSAPAGSRDGRWAASSSPRRYSTPGAPAPWSVELDAAIAAAAAGHIALAKSLLRPGMPFAHPTVEHFAPRFVTLGAAARPEERPGYAIEGYFYGLSKRSFEAR